MIWTVEQDHRRSLATLRAAGTMDGSGCELVRDRVAHLISSGINSFQLDLSQVESINEVGLGSLVALVAQVRTNGRRVELINSLPELDHYLARSGIGLAFDSHSPGEDPIESEFSVTGSSRHDVEVTASDPTGATGPRPDLRAARYIGIEAALEVVDPVLGTRTVSITKTPFLIGRGADNDLLLFDRRISRQAAAIHLASGEYRLRDCGSRSGSFVNGARVGESALRDGDRIDFGLTDSFRLFFHRRKSGQRIDRILTQLDEYRDLDPRARALNQMSLLLEASALVYSQLPIEEILSAVVDRAIELTGAERGALIERDDGGDLRVVVARQQGARPVSARELQFLTISEGRISPASGKAQDLTLVSTWNESRSGSGDGSGRNEIWCCLPLQDPELADRREDQPRGGLYLETGEPAGFASESRELRLQQEQILKALALQAAGVLTNARLVERELEKSHMEQELAIASRIQQSLLPESPKEYGHAIVTGVNQPCYAVGGDYFDHMELSSDLLAFVIADVRGKGLGAALVTTMLQGTMSAMTLGSNPGEVFNHTNRFMCQHSVGHHVTLFFGTLCRDGELRYINAGHHPPFLIRGGVVKRAFEDGCMPLGLMESTRVVEGRATLQPGDSIVLYTDGIPEATNRGGHDYGMDRLEESLRLNSGKSVVNVQDSIMGQLAEFTDGTDAGDDITMVILRYTGGE